jgi:type VI protein secretion system component Hcp
MIESTPDQEARMSEQRDPHSAEPEDLDVDAEQAEDVKGGEGIVSPRDPASGLPTGKRNLHDIVITKPIDKSSPGLG